MRTRKSATCRAKGMDQSGRVARNAGKGGGGDLPSVGMMLMMMMMAFGGVKWTGKSGREVRSISPPPSFLVLDLEAGGG
jgi:hypothetical protein